MDPIAQLTDLVKAMGAGSTDAAPSTLTQGSALQTENLSGVMNLTTFENQHIKLQKMLKVESCKNTLAQFLRQLSYGQFGAAAQFEGNVGEEEISDYVRITVPMCYYSSMRRTTHASTLVATADGKKADERAAADAAIHLAGNIELDCFRGLDDFSNAGTFDGNPLAAWTDSPSIHGLGLQVRQSDGQSNASDLMFSEYGSSQSVVLSAGGVAMTQDLIENAALRTSLAFGDASKLVVDPVALASYNKIVFNKERIVLAGSPQDATGGDLRKQWVSGGTINIEASQFLRAKWAPAKTRNGAPGAPTISVANNAVSTGLSAGVYQVYVTGGSEKGESTPSAASATASITAGDNIVVTITPSGSGNPARYFNVYRSLAGGTAASAKYIGRVKNSGGSNTTFTDLGNKVPAFVTGFLIQDGGANLMELAPYSRMKLAVTDLSTPEAHFRFCALAVVTPRKFVILDNIKGTA